jgi:hypothetical protein
MTESPVAEIFPGGLRQATSIYVAGTSPPLLKWVAIGLFRAYASRLYWTEVRSAGEALESLDPIDLKVVPPERVHVVLPEDLKRDVVEIPRVEPPTATMYPTDKPSEAVRQVFRLLQLPVHTQERIASSFYSDEPALLVLANSHRLTDAYPKDMVAPIVRAITDAGACLVALSAGEVPEFRMASDIVLRVNGSGPSQWRRTTLRCEKGISRGPLAYGSVVPLTELPQVAAALASALPDTPLR